MRALPVTLLALATTVAGAAITPASAAEQVGPIPIDQPAVASYDTGGDWAGIAVTAGRSPQRADGVQLAGVCQFQEEFKPNTNDVVLTVSASASAPSAHETAYGIPSAVGVTCDVVDPSGTNETITVSAAQAGPAVVTASASLRRGHAYTVCVSMNALYSENVLVWTERTCLDGDGVRVMGQPLVP